MEATPSEKTQGLINNTMFSVTQSIDKWTAFLRTSAKMYKQSLNAQLSIHASKPTATACADYQTWRKLGREATNSTKAVKTINKSGRLQYLFDVSDTEQKGNSKMPWIWSAENNHQAINDMINRQYGASEATLEDNIIEMAIKATASFPQNTFGRVATASIAYILLERCGLSGETVVQTSAFDELEKLSDREKDYLVRLTTDISGDLLRQIESTVKLAEKNYRNRGEFLNGQQQSESADRNVPGRDKIRQVSGNAGRTGVVSGHNNGGRDDLHSGREVQQVSVLPDRRESEERGHNRRDEAESSERDLRGGTEPGGRGRTAVLGGRGGRESVPSERNVRNSQTGISSEQQTGTLRTDESGQYPGGTPDSNQQESGRIRGGNGEHLGETRQNGRTIESDRPDGMDTPNEQLQNVSTGSSIRDDSLHLNENENSDEKKAEEEKPSVYVCGVSFKGAHGFEGTEAFYGPFELIHANNLANTTGQTGAFDIDTEQVLAWDPDVIFVDFNGMDLIKEDYATNADFYNSLTAVKEGRVYSQISFRSSASNLETALADAYYGATILYPEQFADVDVEAKTGEIFEMLLGSNPYQDLKDAGYEFRPVTIGE